MSLFLFIVDKKFQQRKQSIWSNSIEFISVPAEFFNSIRMDSNPTEIYWIPIPSNSQFNTTQSSSSEFSLIQSDFIPFNSKSNQNETKMNPSYRHVHFSVDSNVQQHLDIAGTQLLAQHPFPNSITGNSPITSFSLSLKMEALHQRVGIRFMTDSTISSFIKKRGGA